MSTRRLYHFTALYHWPDIFANGGLSKGHLPTLPLHGPQAVNLTENGSKHKQFWYSEFPAIPFDKTKIRITVDVSINKLKSWRQVRKTFDIKSKHIKKIDARSDRRNWFYAFEGVRYQQFKVVEIWHGEQWTQLKSKCQLFELAEIIRKEAQARIVFRDGQNVFYAEGSFLADCNGQSHHYHQNEDFISLVEQGVLA